MIGISESRRENLYSKKKCHFRRYNSFYPKVLYQLWIKRKLIAFKQKGKRNMIPVLTSGILYILIYNTKRTRMALNRSEALQEVGTTERRVLIVTVIPFLYPVSCPISNPAYPPDYKV